MTNKILKFGRPSCMPCKMVENYFNGKGVAFEDYNVEEDLQEVVKYGVSGVPTIILVDENDNILDRKVGYAPPELDELIEQM